MFKQSDIIEINSILYEFKPVRGIILKNYVKEDSQTDFYKVYVFKTKEISDFLSFELRELK
jgi:hypothetical protein